MINNWKETKWIWKITPLIKLIKNISVHMLHHTFKKIIIIIFKIINIIIKTILIIRVPNIILIMKINFRHNNNNSKMSLTNITIILIAIKIKIFNSSKIMRKIFWCFKIFCSAKDKRNSLKMKINIIRHHNLKISKIYETFKWLK